MFLLKSVEKGQMLCVFFFLQRYYDEEMKTEKEEKSEKGKDGEKKENERFLKVLRLWSYPG